MDTNNIHIEVQLDEQKVPEEISWQASASSAAGKQKAKAMVVAFWDAADKSAMRIDLWTKQMMIDEMADFYYQVFMTLGDSFLRATNNRILVDDIKEFAGKFHKKFQEMERAKQK